MVDSGLTDNTAIGHAVSSGAREIFYMGQVMSNGELEDFYRVFAGKKTDTPLIPLTALDFCPFCKANFQVFQQTESEVKSKLQEVSQFFKISPTSSAVTGIRVATLNLTTSQCDYFGIEADRATRTASILQGLEVAGILLGQCHGVEPSPLREGESVVGS
ncbi:unnamed protein product [Durusdinium trenchii]